MVEVRGIPLVLIEVKQAEAEGIYPIKCVKQRGVGCSRCPAVGAYEVQGLMKFLVWLYTLDA